MNSPSLCGGGPGQQLPNGCRQSARLCRSVAGERPPTLPLPDGLLLCLSLAEFVRLLLCLSRAPGASGAANVTVLDDCSSAVWAGGSVTAHPAYPCTNSCSDRASDCCARS